MRPKDKNLKSQNVRAIAFPNFQKIKKVWEGGQFCPPPPGIGLSFSLICILGRPLIINLVDPATAYNKT